MILATCSRNSARQLANAQENREVAEPYEYKSVDEASRSATVKFSRFLVVCPVGWGLLLEANCEDADPSQSMRAKRYDLTDTSKLSQVHMRPHERPVILTSPKRR